ncbi:MAG TPA: hypothetical protein VHH36_05445 [Candidatus Thermoplasmatota archaeon]|nr:hypothetical protein [Candidatus Thermoplasmatota archaeon]
MADMDVLFLAVAILLGFALGVLLMVVVRSLRRRGEEEADDPPPEPPVAHELVEDDAPFAPPPQRRPEPEFDDSFGVASAPAPPPRDELPPPPVEMTQSAIPTEWAKRALGAVEPGRVRGICSGCGTPLSVSKRRPIRIACPVCGRTRVLA